ncbi:hypothetical protein [Pseudonocardia phyllosphaerae]|uniref:hypothetical protein n=1 Tax=Pseudonocardia phyllosphaerae TaxID=3390502 RepID=UPI00397B1423
MPGTETTSSHSAAGEIRSLIERLARTRFGARVVETPIAGYQVLTDRSLDEPTAGIRAAWLTCAVAEGQLSVHARAARAAGRSWDEIGAALDLPVDGFRARDAAAFEWLVEGRDPRDVDDDVVSMHAPSFWWRCPSCDRQITDRGPYNGHPDDDEDGHALGCARHEEDVAAWEDRSGWQQ